MTDSGVPTSGCVDKVSMTRLDEVDGVCEPTMDEDVMSVPGLLVVNAVDVSIAGDKEFPCDTHLVVERATCAYCFEEQTSRDPRPARVSLIYDDNECSSLRLDPLTQRNGDSLSN